MAKHDRSLGDERTQADLPPEPAASVRSLGDQSTHAEGTSSVSDFRPLITNLDESLKPNNPAALATRYEIGEVIGRGGMGAVFKAWDKHLTRPVAFKRILGDSANRETALRRFLAEARSLAQLNHFNIVQVFDYGRDEQGPFLIMEYVAGSSLQEKLKAGRMEMEQAVDMVCQLCDGLSAAHKQGIVHRDVKPANVLLTEGGEPKLTDFGLAHRKSSDDGWTQTGAVLGTIDFMPPEQRHDATQADARSDLWSLAATLYQMLTGKSPKIIRLDLVQESLRPVLVKALEEEPAERYPTTAEFKAALRAATGILRSISAQPAQAGLVEGVCPQCGTQNDQSRKFCKSCRAALTIECLNCKTVSKVWDDVCGECGVSQQEELIQVHAACEKQLEEAATLGREYRFDEALALCTAVGMEKHPSLADLRAQGTRLAAELTARRDEQLRLRGAILADAKSHFDAALYETVLTELEKIPTPLCDTSIQMLRTESRRRIIEMSSLLAEIKRRIAAKELSGLEQLTARMLELQPTHQQVERLHQQLLERLQTILNRVPREVGPPHVFAVHSQVPEVGTPADLPASCVGTVEQYGQSAPAISHYWFFMHDDEQFGPIPAVDLPLFVESGQLRPDDLAWSEGMSAWLPASEIEGLFAYSSPPQDDPVPLGLDSINIYTPTKKRSLRKKAPCDKTTGSLAIFVLLVVMGLIAAKINSIDEPSEESSRGVLSFLVLLILVVISAICRGVYTACPRCQGLWARTVRNSEHLGSERGVSTVLRTDHHYLKGEQIGHTERQEQILVTRSAYNNYCTCCWCEHNWTFVSVTESEGY